GLSEAQVLATTVATYAGGLVSLYPWGRVVDAVGPARVFRWNSFGLAAAALLPVDLVRCGRRAARPARRARPGAARRRRALGLLLRSSGPPLRLRRRRHARPLRPRARGGAGGIDRGRDGADLPAARPGAAGHRLRARAPA